MMVGPHLNLGGGGGAERQTIELANGLVRKGCEVTILLTDKKGDLTSELSSGVKVVFYGSRANLFSRFHSVYKNREDRKTRHSLQ